MNNSVTIDKEFKNINFTERNLPLAEYENCLFGNCIFSNSDLSALQFSECTFSGCDFSMAQVSDTVFRDTKFTDCKLLGLHFDECNQFLLSFIFENCILNFSSFRRLTLRKMLFKNCSLQDVDFSETSLIEAIFERCDLNGAVFRSTILEKADFSSSYNFAIDPENNQIKKAKFSQPGIMGLLYKYDIVID